MRTVMIAALAALTAGLAMRAHDRAQMVHPTLYIGQACGADPLRLYSDPADAVKACERVDAHRLD